MLFDVPVAFHSVKDSAFERSYGWSTVEVRDVHAADAPVCAIVSGTDVADADVDYRNFEGRLWRRVTEPMTAHAGRRPENSEEILKAFRYRKHPLKTRGVSLHYVISPTPARDPVEMEASATKAAIVERAARMIAIDGQAYLSTLGPSMQARLSTQGRRYPAEAILTYYEGSSDYVRASTYDFFDRQAVINVIERAHGTPPIVENHYETIRQTGTLPDRSGFVARAAETLAWRAGWRLIRKTKADATRGEIKTFELLRDALAERASLSFIKRGRNDHAAWPYDEDQIDFRDPSDLIDALAPMTLERHAAASTEDWCLRMLQFRRGELAQALDPDDACAIARTGL